MVDSHTRLTYAGVKQWSDRIALAFHRLGITREHVLALQSPNQVDAYATYLAAQKIGVPLACCAPVLRHKEVMNVLKATGPSAS